MWRATKLPAFTYAPLALIAFVAMTVSAWAQQEVIAAIRVQGNTLTPDDEVVRGSGLSVGMPFSKAVLPQTADRLTATKRFRRVDVLKRYASITDPAEIVVLIQVDEG